MLVSHGAAAVLPDKDKFGIKFESTIPPSVLRVHLDVFLLHTVAVVFNKCLVVQTPQKQPPLLVPSRILYPMIRGGCLM